MFCDSQNGITLNNLVGGTLKQQISYERESGKEKVVLSSQSTGQFAQFETNTQIKENYDFLFAIDTNTEIIDETRVSITASYHVPKNLRNYTDFIEFIPFAGLEIDEVSKAINPEIVGWFLTIKQILQSPTYNKSIRIGVIVDSELSKLSDFNQRRLPYYKESFLPDNIWFIYASSDTGKEYTSNIMISYCDKMAEKIIKYFKENSIKPYDKANGDNNDRGYRSINLQTKT